MKLKELFRTSWVKKDGKDDPGKNKNPEADRGKNAKTDTPEKIKSPDRPEKINSQDTFEKIKSPDAPEKIKSPDTPEKTKSQQSPDKGQSEPRQPQAHVRQSGKLEAPDTTATLEPLAYADPQDWLGSNRDPDVMLAVPNIGVDHIGLVVKNLRAHVDLHAKVLDLVELHVGADVSIEEVNLQINNVRVQAMLKVKLEKVRDIIGDVVGLLDKHPEILSNLTGGLGRGLEGALSRKPGEADQLSADEKSALRKLLQESENKQQQKSIPESENKDEAENKEQKAINEPSAAS